MKLPEKIIYVILLLLIISCHTSMNQKFKWYPTESAPDLYPVNIISAKFLLKDRSGVAIPSGSDIANGWGAIGQIEIVGNEKKSLPAALQVCWFSYIENQFYQGDFVLPTDTLTKVFNEGFLDSNTGKPEQYDRIVVGFAPGGYIAVWAKGGQITTEIAFLKASPLDYDWQKFSHGIDKLRADYITTALNDTLDSNQRKIAAIPFGWNGKYEGDYRKTYSLSITNNLAANVSGALISYYDGSAEYHIAQPAANRWNNHLTIPKRIVWEWKSELGIALGTAIIFDETEIIAAFKKLSVEHPDAPITLQTETGPVNYAVSLILKNQFDSIELKKYQVTTYKQ